MRVKTFLLAILLFVGGQFQLATQALGFEKESRIGFKKEIEDIRPSENRDYWEKRIANDQKVIETLEALLKQMEEHNKILLELKEAQDEEIKQSKEERKQSKDTTSLEALLIENNKGMAKIYRIIEEQTAQQRQFNKTFMRALGAAAQ